jgi:hypothetical protein
VQNAGGTIDVQTQSGAGTTFTILLPLSRGLATPTESAPGAEKAVPQPAV